MGSVYTGGNIIFDENKLISPVGNRVSVFDLVNNKSHTLACENRCDIMTIALSPNGNLLITIDEEGRGLLINFKRGIILAQNNFKKPVKNLKFSPDGKYFAITLGKQIQVWKTPNFNREFSPFQLHRTYTGHYEDVLHISWSNCSEFFITASKDMTCRIYSLNPIEDFIPVLLSGHRDSVVGAWFGNTDMSVVYSVSKDGTLIEWRKVLLNPDFGEKYHPVKKKRGQVLPPVKKTYKWKLHAKHYFLQNHAKVVSTSFHQESKLLTVGFNSGIFGIWELPEFICVHTLSISQNKITSVAVNPTGEWLAFGCAALGQLLVWEWQSESYILKQQGHHYDINTISFSPDGQFIATGADDGKLKLWNTQSGFCFVTFNQHSAAITGTQFTTKNSILFSSSLDGTVRAFDLVRYRNFKTFTAPKPVQFSCLSVDPSGEVVCAGSNDTFEIFIWSVITGNLLDIYTGHEGPVSALQFSPTDGSLVSSSWDKTIRVWDVFSRDTNVEVFQMDSEILSVSFRPDGAQIACSTLEGNISFWDIKEGKMDYYIEGKKDLIGGRTTGSLITAKNQHFESITYSADGSCILGGGTSKYICVYDIISKQLLKKYQLTKNRSFDGVLDQLNSKNMTEAGDINAIDDEDYSDLEERMDKSLPGAKIDPSLRKTKKTIKVKSVLFSPTARSFACATTQGLVVYSLDDYLLFDPFDLEIDVTPDSVLELCKEGDFLKAIIFSFKLGERELQNFVFKSIPSELSTIELIIQGIPTKYLEKLVKYLCFLMENNDVEDSQLKNKKLELNGTGSNLNSTTNSAINHYNNNNNNRIEFILSWLTLTFKIHGRFFKDRKYEFGSVLRLCRKRIGEVYDDLSEVCDSNTYALQYILHAINQKQKKKDDNEKIFLSNGKFLREEINEEEDTLEDKIEGAYNLNNFNATNENPNTMEDILGF
ncbi:hypothetical protein HDU92_007077 [Lobulomyces angularis]|nr:hypothetical protein HDU92_007077 [Lobulomyces angularis]